jgi:GNAT superfamily N-acetyltransferase
VGTLRIEGIADHLDLVDTIARWHWEQWGHLDPEGSLESWTENLRRFTTRDHIPTIYGAFEGDEPLGSVTLNEHDMDTHPELGPWLAGLYVRPSRRRRGVGRALVEHAVREAAGMGVRRLYLYTAAARRLYEGVGWHAISEEPYEGQLVTVMEIELPRTVGSVRISTKESARKSNSAKFAEFFECELRLMGILGSPRLRTA